VIVFQATNRFINLLPVVRRLAGEFGLEAVNVADVPDAEEGPEYWYSSTDQVIVTRNKALLAWPRIVRGGRAGSRTGATCRPSPTRITTC